MQRKILIVEDDADIRENFALELRSMGHEVTTAENGQAARDQLRSTASLPDLIMLDLMMPVMNGWQFRAEQLLDATLAAIPVVVLSGAGDVRQEAAELGAAGYLTKPFMKDALIAVLEQVFHPGREQ